ncbi:MAG TPA: MerR family transcriptional regulator [Sandaracinaceae bacterium LLY-WYZ-13_1]|nr:MerR family transcriptional regulator [Sandaracinaceae bacterium LLY-WYZ-13_1]
MGEEVEEPRLELTVGELAKRAGITVRNVRAYQDRGLLPPPRRRGRAAIYSEVHLLRLRVIQQLLGRGYTLASIGDLLDAWAKGHDLAELMGLESAISSPFSSEAPAHLTLADLVERFGAIPPARIAQAIALGYLEPEEDGFRAPSPRLIHAAEELVASGVPLGALLDQAERLRGDVERIADGFVELVAEHVFDPVGRRRLPPPEEAPRLASIVRRLRPLAVMVVEAELAGALERAAHAELGARLAHVLDHGDD